MVFKLYMRSLQAQIEFENDVKMYGIQTAQVEAQLDAMFENDVKMYGIQTPHSLVD